MSEPFTLDPEAQVDARQSGEPSVAAPSGRVDPLVGVTLGEFTVGGLLARGGRGRVYWATHRELPSLRRAVKVLLDSSNETERAAFLQEAHAVSKVQGLNIVALHDFGRMPTAAREPYLMMELLRGETLEAHLLRAEQMPFMEALELTQQALAALAVIHEAGLVHRDIKPSNLFLVDDPSHGVVLKVMDLGFASARPKAYRETGLGVDRATDRSLTPDYASPEQFGELAVGPPSDVYSLGAVLYEMVTGGLLFPAMPGDSVASMARRHQTEEPTHPALYVPELPAPVGAFMLSLLEKDPLARPTVGAAQNQVRRLRERFHDRFRDGPTQVKVSPLAGPPGPRDTQRLAERAQTEKPVGAATFKGARKPLLVGALIALVVVVGLAIESSGSSGHQARSGDVVAVAPTTGLTVAAAAAPTPSPAPEVGKSGAAAPGMETAQDVTPLPSRATSSAPSASGQDAGRATDPSARADRPSSRLRVLAAASSPQARAPAASVRCEFNDRLVEYAQEQHSIMLERAQATLPPFKAAEEALDRAILAKDCRKVELALEQLRRAVGVPAEG